MTTELMRWGESPPVPVQRDDHPALRPNWPALDDIDPSTVIFRGSLDGFPPGAAAETLDAVDPLVSDGLSSATGNATAAWARWAMRMHFRRDHGPGSDVDGADADTLRLPREWVAQLPTGLPVPMLPPTPAGPGSRVLDAVAAQPMGAAHGYDTSPLPRREPGKAIADASRGWFEPLSAADRSDAFVGTPEQAAQRQARLRQVLDGLRSL